MRPSVREPEVHHVAVLHGVFLAFEAHFTGLFRARLAAQRHEVVVGDGFGADEALLEVGVDHACGAGATVPLVMVQARVSLGPAVK